MSRMRTARALDRRRAAVRRRRLVRAAGAPTAHSAPPKRPNIVVIMTDDQTVESMRVMKNVKRLLVDQGTTFDNSFVSFSLCCPSRATFLTGQYAHNHGVLANKPPYGGYYALDSSNTLPVWLKRAGYETILVGKYLNGYGSTTTREIPPGWTEWHGAVDHSAYQFYGYTLNENGKLVKYGRDAGVVPDGRLRATRPSRSCAGARQRSAVLPLALRSSPRTSGGPPTPGPLRPDDAARAAGHLGRFAAAPLPTPPSFNEADVSDKPGSRSARGAAQRQQMAAITERYQLRLESLLAVDEAVGRIVAALKKKRRAVDDTLIIFTSDNGFLQGEHRIPIGKVDGLRALDASAARHARPRRSRPGCGCASPSPTSTSRRRSSRPRTHAPA